MANLLRGEMKGEKQKNNNASRSTPNSGSMCWM